MSAGLPTRDEMLRRALFELDIANKALSGARDELNSDWRPVGTPLTDDQAAARGTAREAIAAAKRELLPALDALHRIAWTGAR